MDQEVKKSKKNGKPWIALAVVTLVVGMMTGVYSGRKLAESREMGEPSSVAWSSEHGSRALEKVSARESRAAAANRLAQAREREMVRIRSARKSAQESFQLAIKGEHEAFCRRVAARDDGFRVVLAAVPGVVSDYGFRKAWSMAVALGKDRVAEKCGKDANRFSELMDGDLRSRFYQPLQDAREAVVALLPEYAARLEVCREEFAARLSQIPGWDESLGEVPQTLKVESLQIEKVMQALVAMQIGATVSAAFDAAYLRMAVGAASRLLGGAAARFAAGAAVGTATAMADSPAPGPADLVGLGVFGVGVAATAWEVRKAAKVLPEEMARMMRETVDQQRREVRSRVLDEGEKLYLSYSHAFAPE